MLQIEKGKTCCFITKDSEKYTASLDDVREYLEKEIIKAMEEENDSGLEIKDKWMIEHSSKLIKIKLP